MRRRDLLRPIGAAAALEPFAGAAQQPKMAVIGFLNGQSPGSWEPLEAMKRRSNEIDIDCQHKQSAEDS